MSQAAPADPALAGELTRLIAQRYAALSDFKATVLFSVTLGKPNSGKHKRYPAVRGYILLRRPASIRIVGLGPVAGVPIFDLASIGGRYRLFVPSKNRFVTGEGESTKLSGNRIENIRPAHLTEVMMPKPIDAPTESAAAEETGEGAGYTLQVTRGSPGGPSRTLWFDGATLRVARQLVLTSQGATRSDVRYSQWKQDDNIIFPRRIEIDRPQEEYRLLIEIQKIEINRGLTDEMFVLKPPSKR